MRYSIPTAAMIPESRMPLVKRALLIVMIVVGLIALAARHEASSDGSVVRAGLRTQSGPSRSNWGLILDAGSSGTRALLYDWSSSSPLDTVRQRWIHKQQPGLSDCARPDPGVTMTECAQRNIGGLLAMVAAVELWPADAAMRRAAQAATRVQLRATAGLRLLAEAEQSDLLRGVALAVDASPFLDCDAAQSCARMIAGAEEAKYDWLTVNVAFRAWGDGGGRSTLGVIDLGGASTQIAFAPSRAAAAAARRGSGAANVQRVALPGMPPVEIYAVSRLNYGLNEAYRNVLRHGIEAEQDAAGGASASRLGTHPCVLRGVRGSVALPSSAGASDAAVHFDGDGDFDRCAEKVRAFVGAGERSGLGGLGKAPRTPAIPKGMPVVALDNLGFVIIGALWGSFAAPDVPRFKGAVAQRLPPQLNGMASPSLLEIAAKGRIFCKRPWSEIREIVDDEIRVRRGPRTCVCLRRPCALASPPMPSVRARARSLAHSLACCCAPCSAADRSVINAPEGMLLRGLRNRPPARSLRFRPEGARDCLCQHSGCFRRELGPRWSRCGVPRVDGAVLCANERSSSPYFSLSLSLSLHAYSRISYRCTSVVTVTAAGSSTRCAVGAERAARERGSHRGSSPARPRRRPWRRCRPR